MTLIVEQDLEAWAVQRGPGAGRERPRCAADQDRRGLRFAFYGRTSTADHQDRLSSCGWQREVAENLIAGCGLIVGDYYEVGCSRRLSWSQRPQAAELLAELLHGEGRSDAVVVGEYERAFACAEQFEKLAAALDWRGIQLWLPETGGRVEHGIKQKLD